ncbi:aspartyl protease family protein [Patulibacter defluvii]|uniref:aspartyl protease family protein n=1 Tax=Patulibacter defluvii TaxID=3095358 RepID=UPI002A7627FF|nr:aspartyl protease family protein [Patulibacter sp. DM4]
MSDSGRNAASTSGPAEGRWGRRAVLQGAAAMAGAAAFARLPESATASVAAKAGGSADALFEAGRFEQAGRAYEAILERDPRNLHAARQRGYVGLLANRFPEAEKYLTIAHRLRPEDQQTNQLLGDCYLRQDELARAAPHWKAAGEDGYAAWFAAVRGQPYRIHGDVARLPIEQMDPMPLVQASVNGGPPKRFTFYTGAPNLSLTASTAREAGVRAVASQKIEGEGGAMWAHYGILDAFTLGGLELRNVPVGWSSTESGDDLGADGSDGMIGTWVFYHLLTTFDYVGRSLILRRRTPESARKARVAATRAGAEPQPLWLALDHYLHSTGSVAGAVGSGPRVVGVNFGGSGGESAAVVLGKTAERLRIRSDHDRPIGTFAHSHPAVTYPCYPTEIRVGAAAARHVYCETHPNQPVNVPWPYGTGFDAPAAFFHCFWKPFTVTLDFTDMKLYVARGKRSRQTTRDR